MFKKLFAGIVLMFLIFGPSTAWAATFDTASPAVSQVAAPRATAAQQSAPAATATPTAAPRSAATLPTVAPAQTLPTIQTIGFRGGSHGFHSFGRSSSRSFRGGSTFRPGYGRLGGGFSSHMFSFGAGWMLGSMFHPFGGYYGWGSPLGYHHFSLLGILFDLVILWIIWRIIRFIFRRR